MRSDLAEAWERTPPELLSPREAVPPGRRIRILAGLLGALAGAAGAVVLFYAVCEEEGCAFPPITEIIGVGAVLAVVIGSLAIAVTLDFQRWRARRRAGAAGSPDDSR